MPPQVTQEKGGLPAWTRTTPASRQEVLSLKLKDKMILRLVGNMAALRYGDDALELPYIPPFLHKEPGYVFSIGQFNQWVGSQVMGSRHGPDLAFGMPVARSALMDGKARSWACAWPTRASTKRASPTPASCPAWTSAPRLTVIGDGPVGPVGRALDETLGLAPRATVQRDWALGHEDAVVDLPEALRPARRLRAAHLRLSRSRTSSASCTCCRTAWPRWASSCPPGWISPVRTGYRYLQHWMTHPAIHGST